MYFLKALVSWYLLNITCAPSPSLATPKLNKIPGAMEGVVGAALEGMERSIKLEPLTQNDHLCKDCHTLLPQSLSPYNRACLLVHGKTNLILTSVALNLHTQLGNGKWNNWYCSVEGKCKREGSRSQVERCSRWCSLPCTELLLHQAPIPQQSFHHPCLP